MENDSFLSYHEFFYSKIGEDRFFEEADCKPFNMFFERPAMISMFPDLKGKTALDAGCAAGWFSDYMFKRGADVTAVDLSDNMLMLCRKRLGDNAKIYKCDLSDGLPFLQDESMDFVLSSLTLDYVKDWNMIMDEFYRILKRGGALLFSAKHPYDAYSSKRIETYYQTLNMEHEYEEYGEKVSVFFYKRPLQDMIMPVINSGFKITSLSEPVPTLEFKEVRPDLYDRYAIRPEYLIVKAVKHERQK
ncbi:MAG: class I SAM-dependent methyltransferase [Clostridiales bacterium]|jgi:ubiquinone/menaquinone biosynthesis C-methylase UbiE|nr:class I SAM-dependent methyltransferase [Clostridiales bacterium]